MRNQRKHTCEICGKRLNVVISGKNETERLCARCLAATYPALKELAKIM